MAALPWKEDYRINISVIDEQHREIAVLAGRLHDALKDEKPSDDVYEALGEMIAFTRLHFATEEELMRKYRYPDYAAHRASHREILAQLQGLATHLPGRVFVRFGADHDPADDWVTSHLLEHDVSLGRFLSSRGVL